MGRKGKKKGASTAGEGESSQQTVAKQDAQAPPNPQQQQQGGSDQQLQKPTDSQQQQLQRPPVPQQQQQGGPGNQPQGKPSTQQQQRPPGPQQQQPQWPRPQQQQQGRPGPQQQHQQRPPGPQQQQPQWPRPQQQQQGGPGPQQQQQQRPPGPQQQQPQWPRPQQQQQGRPGPQQQQQQRPPGPQQQQPQWPRPQQQQQGGPGPQQQQQQRPPGPQQQQPQWPRPQQQQQGGPGPQQQQQQRPPGPQQQQPQWPRPQQQQQEGPGPQQQQQQRPPGPQVQQPSAAPQISQEQVPPMEGQPPQQSKDVAALSTALKKTAPFADLRTSKAVFEKGALSPALIPSYQQLIPKRSVMNQGGTQGRRITVETNMFRLDFGKFETSITHYDVDINPDKPKYMMRQVFEQFRKMQFPKRYPAFDGKKNAYSAQVLPFGTESPLVEVTVPNEDGVPKTFKVKMKKAAELDLSWLNTVKPGFCETEKENKGLQALDIILRHGPANQLTTFGRSIFIPPQPGRDISLTGGLDLWNGVFQSAVIGWRPYLNFDVAHKGFPRAQAVIELMKELCKTDKLNPQDVQYNEAKIVGFLKGLKVNYEIPGIPASRRTHRVNGLVECPRKNQFALKDGTLCTVEKYYIQEKKYSVRYPDIPCLWVGSRQNKIYVPPELCTIVGGQVTQKKMDEEQTRVMIKKAAVGTAERKEKIMNGFASLKLNSYPTVKDEFKLSVHGQFEVVPARVLNAPTLEYAQKMQCMVRKGVWRTSKFLMPMNLPNGSWTILNLDKFTKDPALYQLSDGLIQNGSAVNMQIGQPQTPFQSLAIQRDVRNLQAYFDDKKQKQLKLVVVVIPNLPDAYCKVKQVTELSVGILTQCIKSATLRRINDQTLTNILFKINSKLNGINHKLSDKSKPPCLQTPCMIVGADVTHPSPDAVNIPSIAAVTASFDSTAFKYNIEIRLQPPREEMILDFERIMCIQLQNFKQKTNCLPKKIIVFRDGVSDGQLPQVMHYELSALRRACTKILENYMPQITFLVVQKRHHIRLFPTDPRNSDDKNLNVQAGTIVDTNITHPSHIDFYLVSHASIQGTARPTKYRCIWNDGNMLEDEIEQLTYYLCHLFARCTRSVSYPAPTYYAHLAAFRARALIQNVPLRLEKLEQEQISKLTLKVNTDSPMFFV